MPERLTSVPGDHVRRIRTQKYPGKVTFVYLKCTKESFAEGTERVWRDYSAHLRQNFLSSLTNTHTQLLALWLKVVRRGSANTEKGFPHDWRWVCRSSLFVGSDSRRRVPSLWWWLPRARVSSGPRLGSSFSSGLSIKSLRLWSSRT